MILFLLFFSIAFSAAHTVPKTGPLVFPPLKEVTATRGMPWPLPQQHLSSANYFSIDPSNFKFLLLDNDCDILVEATERYRNISFIDGCGSNFVKKPKSHFSIDPSYLGQILNLTIKTIQKCDKYPSMDMDEQYLLKINDPDLPGQALLFSTTVWGALRGLETFSQLVYQLKSGQFVINTTSILDFPRFSYRGFLLDTSRHYISVPRILENLDLMAQSKLNVFHWHIVDDPSFPYVSKEFPDLSRKGAFDPITHIYDENAVALVIEYARLRGIRVLVEFDTPGHTLSWGKSQSSLLTACYNNKSQPIPNSFGPIDPTNDTNFHFLKSLFSEIAGVFPDNYIHLGGDEVDFSCWKSNPFILKFMAQHKFGSDFSLLEQFYVQRVLDIVQSLNKSYIVWQEVFDNNVKVKPDTVIHVWKDGYQSELKNVTAAGFKSILSSCWYLNEINYGIDWPSYYVCDPHNFNGTDQQKKLVVGGEACMWAEFLDGSNVITRTWPRTSVVAERLWSAQSVNDTSTAAPRLEEFHCKLIKRGHKVEPVNGPGFCECDYKL